MLYRLHTSTIGICIVNGYRVIITIPSGALLNVNQPVASSTSPVEVEWLGKVIRMFPIDILQRAEEVQP
jgi:hypothetical protein